MKRVVMWAVGVVVVACGFVATGLYARDARYARDTREQALAEMEVRLADKRHEAEVKRAEAERLRAGLFVLTAAGTATDECRARADLAERAANSTQRALTLMETELRVYRDTGIRPSLPWDVSR